MKLQELPQDIREKVIELARQFQFPADEVAPYYLMGGDHTDQLLTLKSKGASDQLIAFVNQRIYDEKNKKLWQELNALG